MDKSSKAELKILKIILWVYIIMCIIIAGLNYGYASRADAQTASFISKLWHFYENWVKTLFIIAGSYLTIRIIGKSKRTVMRKRNLIGFTAAALIVHIFAPFLLNVKELYFFTMPLPWTTTSLQLLYPESTFYLSRYPVWGAAGVSAALVFFICYSLVILIGTFLLGRRWQCSTLCLFNGFASEVFDPAIPLIGKNKKPKEKIIRSLSVLRWIFLSISIFFTLWWILFLLGMHGEGVVKLLSRIENYKYLSTELLMAMFFWVAFLGRGYCYYCPLGTVLAWISKIAGQKIATDKSKCIKCSQCNLACPMFIDVKAKASEREELKDIRCVGCCHCIDACPTKTLEYSTTFLHWIVYKRKRVKKLNDISKGI